MTEKTIYKVTDILPKNRQKVKCLGHLTYCCKKCMQKEMKLHTVIFNLDLGDVLLKKQVPEDPEESILESYKVTESWQICDDSLGAQVIGVTEWMELDD